MNMNDELAHEAVKGAAIEQWEFALVAALRPRIFIDGNAWCVLYGENVQDGVAGFGSTPRLAVYDFNKAWDRPIPGGGE